MQACKLSTEELIELYGSKRLYLLYTSNMDKNFRFKLRNILKKIHELTGG